METAEDGAYIPMDIPPFTMTTEIHVKSFFDKLKLLTQCYRLLPVLEGSQIVRGRQGLQSLRLTDDSCKPIDSEPLTFAAEPAWSILAPQHPMGCFFVDCKT
jgi:hypothetical protein